MATPVTSRHGGVMLVPRNGTFEVEAILSTAHITKEDNDILHAQACAEGSQHFPVEETVFAYRIILLYDLWEDNCRDMLRAGMGASFMRIVRDMHALGCSRVVFDADGPEWEDYLTFVW